MAKPIELGLVLEGKDAEEFLKNEKGSKFTPEQLTFFRRAIQIYQSNKHKF